MGQEKSAAKNFEAAIIFTPRKEISEAFRQGCKESGIKNIFIIEEVVTCLETLDKHSDGLLVLDWGIGPAMVYKVLQAITSPTRIDIRPVLLFSLSEVEGIEGVAAEYGVAHLHQGEVSQNVIRAALKTILSLDYEPDEIMRGIREAVKNRRLDAWEKAGAILEVLHEKNPDNERIMLEYAENLYHESRHEDALARLQPLINRENPNNRAVQLAARCQMKLGKFKEATILFEKARLANPFHTDRLVTLGDAYLHLQKTEQAKETYKEALDLDPKSQGALRGLGQAFLMDNEINEALVFLKQMSGPREMASVFNAAAVLNMRAGKFKEGMRLYKVAMETIPSDLMVSSKLAFNVGIGFLRQRQNQNAHRAFGIATKLDPGNQKAKDNFDTLSAEFPSLKLSESNDLLINMLKELCETLSLDDLDPGDAEEEDLETAS